VKAKRNLLIYKAIEARLFLRGVPMECPSVLCYFKNVYIVYTDKNNFKTEKLQSKQ
jgi:hypothetical protein